MDDLGGFPIFLGWHPSLDIQVGSSNQLTVSKRTNPDAPWDGTIYLYMNGLNLW